MRQIDGGTYSGSSRRVCRGPESQDGSQYVGHHQPHLGCRSSTAVRGCPATQAELPRRPKKQARFFTLPNVAKIIAASEGEHRVFYWLAAETGLRSGELAGLKLTDLDGESLTVNRSVWQGDEQAPKTNNSVRSLGLSPQLVSLLWEQIARQRAKEDEFMFSSSNGTPWDMNVYRRRKMAPPLKRLGIAQGGFNAFRHFNVSLLDAMRVPLKTIQERAGHALTGVFTLDVYGGQPEFERNLEPG